MVILIDTREKERAITRILAQFELDNVRFIKTKLDVGDYMELDNPKIVIDRKQNLMELANNVSHNDLDRFNRELQRAKDNGIHLIFLIEHSNQIKELSDVIKWENKAGKKYSKWAMDGVRLYRILDALQKTYGVKYEFCDKQHTGKRIIELLSNEKP